MSNYNRIVDEGSQIELMVNDSSDNEAENSEYICYICLDAGDTDDLISPCKCDGTTKYVHKKCLLNWIYETTNPESREKCTICKHEYQFIDNNIQAPCIINMVLNDGFIFLFFIFNVILPIITLDFYFDDITLEKIDKTYLYLGGISLFAFWILLLTIHFIFINNKSTFIKIFKDVLIDRYKTLYTSVIVVYIILSFISFIFYLTAITLALTVIIKLFYLSLYDLNRRDGRDILPYEEDHP